MDWSCMSTSPSWSRSEEGKSIGGGDDIVGSCCVSEERGHCKLVVQGWSIGEYYVHSHGLNAAIASTYIPYQPHKSLWKPFVRLINQLSEGEDDQSISVDINKTLPFSGKLCRTALQLSQRSHGIITELRH